MLDKPGLLSVIHNLLDSILAIWTFHNTQCHSANNAIHKSETTRQTIKAISELYELQDDVLPLDRHLFRQSPDVHLTKSQSSLCAWLSNLLLNCIEGTMLLKDSMFPTQIPLNRIFHNPLSLFAPLP